MSRLRERYLHELGIPVFVLRSRQRADDARGLGAPEAEPPADLVRPQPASSSAETREIVVPTEWPALAEAVKSCTRCALHRGRKQAVFGVGPTNAELMVVGEAPGADEDRQGEPFVGAAGRLLNAMLRAIGFPRSSVYIANILKCRPPNNRDPRPEEAVACTPFLERQIELVSPKALLAVGRISAQWLLQTDAPIGRLRGRVFRYREIPLVVTYHPAYLLRTPLAKATAWQDLCMVRQLLVERS
ncbi:MAG TPA: uracil-DNA glycosylase [Gammaproteobacteria bacterium]